MFPPKAFISLLAAVLLSACSSSSIDTPPNTSATTEPTIDPQKELATVPEDTARYRGFKCGDFRLGVSFAQFKKEAGKRKITMTEVQTNYPGLLRKFDISLAPPVKGMEWTPVAKFVDDGSAYRLYEIEGNIRSSDGSIVRKLSQKLGPSTFRGITYKWVKRGTNVRLMQDSGRDALLSFTDDKTADVAGEKMAEAVDSGNYRH